MKGGVPVADGQGTTWVVCGTGGYELTDKFIEPEPEWIAFRQGEKFGYCKIDVNETHLHFQHIGIDRQFRISKKNPTVHTSPTSLEESTELFDDVWI